MDLPLIWAFLIAFAVMAYVVLDGFDLGVGILFPFVKGEAERDEMMNSVAPVWDGNETWLVLGGGGLFAVFPLAFSIIMPALYAPIIAMLVGLVFRGVAFEFRWKTRRGQWIWDASFALGSIVAAVAQGIALGALLQGIEVEGRTYAGASWDWLTPFSLLCGAAVLTGYALLGATWLVMKTEGQVQAHALAQARILAVGMIVAIAGVSLATPFLLGQYYQRWFTFPGIIAAAPVPILVAACAVGLLRALALKKEVQPFLLTLALFGLSFLGLGISIFPDIVPGEIGIAEAAAPDESLLFLLVGASVLIPMILAYTAYSYWVFRGKVNAQGAYHR
jgi:cytochrome bd ubiquinol oxidase subunit II